MRVILLAFDPEAAAHGEAQARSLWPGVAFEVERVLPSLELADDPLWAEEVVPDLTARLARTGEDWRVLHVRPAQFVEALFGGAPPTLVVLAYREWSERVAVCAGLLAARRFPVLSIGCV